MATFKSSRSKACDIPPAVKKAVWERDHHRCVLCLSPNGIPNAHFIPRSQGGLGVERNILTLCPNCHRAYDQTTQRKYLQVELRAYLQDKYKDWNEDELIFKGW